MSNIFKKILLVYFLVLTLGISISTLIYTNGQAVSNAIHALVSDNLPRLNDISKLRATIFAQKPLLYEYYANTDRAVFIQKFELNQREIEKNFRTIHTANEGIPLMNDINTYNDQINTYAVQLDKTLSARNVDWDLAREILTKVSLTEEKVSPVIDELVSINQQQVLGGGEAARAKTDWIVLMVIGFSVVISIIAILIGYQVNAYLSENIERKRLAMFPERNPSPVLRVNWQGKIVYKNPATQTLLNQLELNDPTELMPANFTQSFPSVLASGQDNLELEGKIKNRDMNYVVHILKDLQISHVYITDISKRKQAEKDLIHQALHDPLTDLPNRRKFNEHLQIAIQENISGHMIGILFMRIDRMKRFLESRGYDASDSLMQALALRLKELLNGNQKLAQHAFLFHFDSSTFGILLPRITDMHTLVLLAEKLMESMVAPFNANGQELVFTLSIGASIYPVDGHNPEILVKNAETAVNRVIASGGNGFQCYTQDMNEMAERLLAMENSLRHALEKNELVLLYQPQIQVSNGSVIGAEALVRWNRDHQGFVSPVEFIPIAEETGLIIPIGEWILRTACLQAKSLHQQGFADFIMAVNISAKQFQHANFVQMVAQTLQETNLHPSRLELEITESMAMYDAEKNIATMNELRALGIQLSIDDFGTGYSSLSYLKRFPINKLKVDQSFVRNMTSNSNDASITKTVILLGQSLNLTVIAEGVETEEQLALLKQYGCDEVQGYLYSKPISHEQLLSFLQART